MKASKLGLLTLMACTLAACSSTTNEQKNEKFYYKASAVKVRPLEVPPDLTTPLSNDRYGIPGGDEEGVRYSDFARGGARAGSDVLPEARNVRLVSSGKQRWLEVNDKAENIWPLVKAFWQENGLIIKTDNLQAGMIETEWAENRVKAHISGLHNQLGGAFDGLYSAAEKDQYLTRLERARDGKVTEITIKHNGLQEVQSAGQGAYKWVPRPSDSELETTMLQLLMTRLSGVAQPAAAAQMQPAVVSTVSLKTLADGSKGIQLNEPFDKSWRRVSLALEQAGIAVEDKDRSKGMFFLRAARNKTDKTDAAQIVVRESGAGCEVTSANSKGGSTPDTQRLIDTLYQQLGRQ